MQELIQPKQTKFIFPQEMEVWYVLPAIRREFALSLIEAGLSQKKIAQILGITEAAVSQYKTEKRAKELVFSNEVKQKIKESAKKVMHQPETIFREIMNIDDYLKSNGIFCQLHRTKTKTPEGCEGVCSQHFFPKTEFVQIGPITKARN